MFWFPCFGELWLLAWFLYVVVWFLTFNLPCDHFGAQGQPSVKELSQAWVKSFPFYYCFLFTSWLPVAAGLIELHESWAFVRRNSLKIKRPSSKHLLLLLLLLIASSYMFYKLITACLQILLKNFPCVFPECRYAALWFQVGVGMGITEMIRAKSRVALKAMVKRKPTWEFGSLWSWLA